GWVAPLSNRLAAGTVLYADGAHVPMPPLPFVVIELLTHGHATWLTESRLNFLFQVLMVATLYAWLAFQLPGPLAFLVTFVALPIYFSLPKTVACDSMAQCFAAWAAILL